MILSMPHAPLPAKQARSRKSLERLLDAAEEVLKKHGLEGATVPRIAAQAGLSPASVYRRFPDKDALMRAVALRYYARVHEKSRHNLRPELWKGTSLRQKTYIVILNMIAAHQAQAALLRPLIRFCQQHPDFTFRRRTLQLEMSNFRQVIELFLEHRDDIRHPDPELAVTFGLLIVVFTMREIYLVVTGKRRWEDVFPAAVAQLDRELPRMFLRYLGVKDPDAPPEPHPALKRLEECRRGAESGKTAGRMRI
jgi:AcrR family transcriptional regulator